MNCESVRKQLSLLLYGELSFDQDEELHQHLESCGTCRAEFEREKLWHAAADSCEPDVAQHLLDQCRRDLRLAVAAESERRPGLWSRLAAWIAPHGFTWNDFWKPVSGVALLSIGFLGGRYLPMEQEPGQVVSGPSPTTASLARLSEPVSSRVRYVQPDDSGRVQIMVEEVRQRILRGGIDDDSIRNLLLTAATESNDPGVRVETVDLLKGRCSSDQVRRALLTALQHDANAGVRLKAIEGLRPLAGDPETRRVLAKVLLTDKNPGVRTQAIEMLTAKSEPALAGVLKQLLAREDNNYIRLKCRRALSELSMASESF